MGIETVIILATVGLITNIIAGAQKKEAFDKEAELLEEQGVLAQFEAEEEARRIEDETVRFEKKQKLAFLKAGVTLSGSPLFVFEETRTEGFKQSEAVRRRGRAQVTLSQRKADITRSSGRAAFVGGIGQGIGSAASTLSAGGVFDE